MQLSNDLPKEPIKTKPAEERNSIRWEVGNILHSGNIISWKNGVQDFLVAFLRHFSSTSIHLAVRNVTVINPQESQRIEFSGARIRS
jgi:hypothetical protein